MTTAALPGAAEAGIGRTVLRHRLGDVGGLWRDLISPDLRAEYGKLWWGRLLPPFAATPILVPMIVVGIGYAPSELANPMRPMTHFGVLRRAVDFTPNDLPLQRPPDRGTICRVRAIERVPPAKQQSPS